MVDHTRAETRVIQCRATAVAGCTAENRRLLHGGRVRAAICDDDVRRECRNFRSVFPDAVCITGTPTVLDPQIAAYDPAQFLQPLGNAATWTGASASSAAMFMSTPMRRTRSGPLRLPGCRKGHATAPASRPHRPHDRSRRGGGTLGPLQPGRTQRVRASSLRSLVGFG